MKVDIKIDYAKRRRESYPSIEEQLDAIWKGGAEEAAMRIAIQTVKAKFPKK